MCAGRNSEAWLDHFQHISEPCILILCVGKAVKRRGDQQFPGSGNSTHKHLHGGDSIPSSIFPPRHNYENITNKNGSQLLQLCRKLGMYIVNGKLWGDSYGRYTYSSSLGSSTVDYFITDLNPESLRVFSQATDTPIRSQQNHTQLEQSCAQSWG
jgi:hypothetical protein